MILSVVIGPEQSGTVKSFALSMMSAIVGGREAL
jgi:hypothetical protein